MAMYWPRSRKLIGEEPNVRTGLCHGERCRKNKKRAPLDQTLYLVSRSRYRCRDCYKVERGYYP